MRRLIFAAMLLSPLLRGWAADELAWFQVRAFPQSPVSSVAAIPAAVEIQTECDRILNLVPRLSPAENAWLQRELKAKRDLGDLSERPEYARHVLYVHFQDCAKLAHMAAVSKSDHERVAAWARLASHFSVTSDLHYFADRAGVDDLRGSVKRFVAWERAIIFRIIDNIVLPFILHSRE